MSEVSSPHGRPSALAQASIQLVRAARRGVLCTLTTDGGYPYGSLVEFLSLPDGDIVLLLSSLAEHQHNMAADARVSLLIAPHIDEADALAKPRVTLVGKAGEVDAREQSAIAEAYFARHPTARLSGAGRLPLLSHPCRARPLYRGVRGDGLGLGAGLSRGGHDCVASW